MAISSTKKELKETTGLRNRRETPVQARSSGLAGRLVTWGYSLWRRRWLSMSTAWIICLAGWGAITLWPTSFFASAVVHADLTELIEQNPVATLPDGSPNTILRSLLLSDEAVEEIRSEVALDDVAMQTLRDDFSLRSTVPPVFVLTYTHQDPSTARQVVETVIQSFRDKLDGSAEASIEAITALNEQIDDYQQRIQSADDELAAFRSSNADSLEGQVSRGVELAFLEEEVASLIEQVQTTTDERDALALELAEVQSEAVPELDAALSPSPEELEQISAERATLETELAKLQERYADSHPYVMAVFEAIEALNARAEVAPPDPEALQIAEEAQKNREELEQQHEELILAVSDLNSSLTEKRNEIELLVALTETTSSVEAKLAELESDKGELTVALADLQQQRDELGEIETGEVKQESFRLIRQPELPTDPVGPSRLMALAAVLVGGAGIGAAVALICNRLKGVYESAWQLRQRFDVGVLGTISEVMTPAERKQLGYSRLVIGLVGLALVGVFSGLAVAEMTDRLAPIGDQLRSRLLG